MILTERDREFLGELAKVVMKWPEKGSSQIAMDEVDSLVQSYTELEAKEMRERFPKP